MLKQALHAMLTQKIAGMHNETNSAETVRQYVSRHYIEPARDRGDTKVTVSVGEVHKALGLKNRVPLVCTALRSRKFLDENRLELREDQGPPSGLSTTVVLVYEFQNVETSQTTHPLLNLRGAGREVFTELGGGEEFLKREREAFFGLTDER